MPILEIQTPDGRTIEIDSPDGQMPDEATLDAMVRDTASQDPQFTDVQAGGSEGDPDAAAAKRFSFGAGPGAVPTNTATTEVFPKAAKETLKGLMKGAYGVAQLGSQFSTGGAAKLPGIEALEPDPNEEAAPVFGHAGEAMAAMMPMERAAGGVAALGRAATTDPRLIELLARLKGAVGGAVKATPVVGPAVKGAIKGFRAPELAALKTQKAAGAELARDAEYAPKVSRFADDAAAAPKKPGFEEKLRDKGLATKGESSPMPGPPAKPAPKPKPPSPKQEKQAAFDTAVEESRSGKLDLGDLAALTPKQQELFISAQKAAKVGNIAGARAALVRFNKLSEVKIDLKALMPKGKK